MPMTTRQVVPAVLTLIGALALTYLRVLRPWMYRWGATDDEVAGVLPGDDLVQPGRPRTTRAVAVDAPVDAVWPWLAQIGEDRGGFYSYDRLERLVGADMHNAEEIYPQWQDVHVGDTVWLARRYGWRSAMIVAEVTPLSHLALVSVTDFDRIRHGDRASGAWTFVLRPADRGTRLIARGTGRPVGNPVYDIAHFVMERAMLRGLAGRAERAQSLSRDDRG